MNPAPRRSNPPYYFLIKIAPPAPLSGGPGVPPTTGWGSPPTSGAPHAGGPPHYVGGPGVPPTTWGGRGLPTQRGVRGALLNILGGRNSLSTSVFKYPIFCLSFVGNVPKSKTVLSRNTEIVYINSFDTLNNILTPYRFLIKRRLGTMNGGGIPGVGGTPIQGGGGT
jgi:hypothetical protein